MLTDLHSQSMSSLIMKEIIWRSSMTVIKGALKVNYNRLSLVLISNMLPLIKYNRTIIKFLNQWLVYSRYQKGLYSFT